MRKLLLTGFSVFLLLAAAGCSLRPASSTTTSSPSTSSSSSTSTVAPTTTTSLALSSTTSTTTETYGATLSGKNEIPTRSGSATGFVSFTVDSAGTTVAYVVLVDNINNVTLVKIHEGKAGATGAAIATLFGGPTKSGSLSGVLSRGSLTAADLVGPLKGKTIADFLKLVTSGQLYVNVGTTTHPSGEIRGQIK